MKQWTNVLRTSCAIIDHPRPTWTHTRYIDRSGRVAVDAYSVEGGSHSLAFEAPEWAQLAVDFFGIARRH